jgi:hypothetical protein
MPANLNLTLDASGLGLLSGGGQAFTFDDSYNVRLRVLQGGADAALSGPSFKLVFGKAGAVPASGTFKLTTSTGTSQEIAYNATTAAVLTAVSAIAGNVSVTTYGSSGSAWLVTAATANSALSFSGVTFSLFPSSTVRITTQMAPASGVTAAQIVELVRLPAVSAVTFAAASTAGVVTFTLLQDGSATANETYRLAIGADAIGGSYGLVYGSNATSAVALNASSSVLQTALSAVTGLGANIAVNPSSGVSGHQITFVNALALTNVSTAVTLDGGGIQYARWYEGSITFSGVDLRQLFVESGGNTCTGLLEVEMTESSRKTTLLQAQATVRLDVQP